MNRFIDIVIKISPLIQTIGEAFVYSKDNIESMEFEKSHDMLLEIVDAFKSIQLSLIVIKESYQMLNEYEYLSFESQFEISLSMILNAFNSDSIDEKKDAIDKCESDFLRWSNTLERIINYKGLS